MMAPLLSVDAMDSLLMIVDDDESSSCYSSDSEESYDDWALNYHDGYSSMSDDSMCSSDESINDTMDETLNISLRSERNVCCNKTSTNDPKGCEKLLREIIDLKKQLQQAIDKKEGGLNSVSCGRENSCPSNLAEYTGENVGEKGVMSLGSIAALRRQTNPKKDVSSFCKSASTGMLQQRCIQIVQAKSAQEVACSLAADVSKDAVQPDQYLRSLIKSEASNDYATVYSAESLGCSFFFQWTEENFAAYSSELVSAIRSNNLHKVKELHAEGRNLLGCNKFGESVMHMICRHGSAELLAYFMHVVNVPIRLKDDSGRTPLHDACWTDKPNFDCAQLIVETCPEMLFISDNRGFTPLAYVPRTRWADWCSFLENNIELIKSRERR